MCKKVQFKICVVTGTRAEYGLLRNLLLKLRDTENVKLDLVVTGSHLSDQFGNTPVSYTHLKHVRSEKDIYSVEALLHEEHYFAKEPPPNRCLFRNGHVYVPKNYQQYQNRPCF